MKCLLSAESSGIINGEASDLISGILRWITFESNEMNENFQLKNASKAVAAKIDSIMFFSRFNFRRHETHKDCVMTSMSPERPDRSVSMFYAKSMEFACGSVGGLGFLSHAAVADSKLRQLGPQNSQIKTNTRQAPWFWLFQPQ